MKLEYLKNLVYLYEEKSINKAAARLGITSVTLSKDLYKLEESIGKELFKTTNKGVIFTREGYKLYEYSKSISNLLESTKIPEKDYRKNYIIAVESKINLNEILYSFNKNSIEINERYNFRELYREEILSGVLSKKYSLGFITVKKDEKINLEDSGVNYKKISVGNPVIVVGKEHPLAIKDKISLKELSEYSRISFENIFDNYFDFKYNLKEKYGIDRGKIHVKHIGDVFIMLRNNSDLYFIMNLSKSKDILLGDLKALEIEEISEKIEIGYIYNKDFPLDKELKSFVSALK